MLMKNHLRIAEEADYQRIVEIYNCAIPTRVSTSEGILATVQSKLDWLTSHSDLRPIYVYERGKQILGWASFEDFYSRFTYHATAELSIHIDPKFQDQGIGEAILDSCIEQAPSLGIQTILGYVFAHNVGSKKMLEKCGFQQWGYLPEVAEMDGTLYSLSIWGLKISSPTT